MGEVIAKIRLVNAFDEELAKQGMISMAQVRSANVDAYADTGARTLALPESLANQLGLREVERATVRLGDGSTHERSIRGYVLTYVTIDGITRNAISTCIVGPDESPILLGQVPLEVMDLRVDCPRQRLVLGHPGVMPVYPMY